MNKRTGPLAGVALLSILTFVAGVGAVSTRSFVLDSHKVLSEGKLEGTAVYSSGTVVRGVQVDRVAIPGTAVARSLLTTKDGRTFIGSGNDGKIFLLTGGDLRPYAETGELLVTSLVQGPAGALYAATLPNGKIFSVDSAGKVSTFCQPEGVQHVWALVYDAKRKTLFAATGPDGKVYAIDAKGKPSVYLDTEAEHVMALAADRDGTLYAGTSDSALLLRLRAPGKAEVVYDFEGNEVTAIDVRDGAIAVAANLFPKAPASKPPKHNGKDTDSKKDAPPKAKAGKGKASTRPKPGKGQLWRIEPDGRARALFDSDKGHITAVQWAADDTIYAATGKDGLIYRVGADGHYALWVDVDERQVLAMDLASPTPRFVTGDAAAVYRVQDGKAQDALWTSKVLDASYLAQWGQLSWRGRGKLSLQTRSGNTEKPDDSWSAWSSVMRTPGPIRSAGSRFMQLRAHVPTDGVLYAATAYYLPRNQAAVVAGVDVAPKKKKKPKAAKASGAGKPSRAGSQYTVSWRAANPDGDRLRYRLSYQREGGRVWRPLLREHEVLTDANFTWQTNGIADGYYRVRVEASDELDNPGGSAEVHSAESEPVRVDNHPPLVQGLKYAKGVLAGQAVDGLGPVSRLEYKLDADDWRVFFPKDGLLDTASERFELALSGLGAGAHAVAVRATDSRGNVGSAELEIVIR